MGDISVKKGYRAIQAVQYLNFYLIDDYVKQILDQNSLKFIGKGAIKFIYLCGDSEFESHIRVSKFPQNIMHYCIMNV